MKNKSTKETDELRRADVNLRAALHRRHARVPELPADFTERLKEKMFSPEGAQPLQKSGRIHLSLLSRKRVAAIFLGFVLISGITFATIRHFNASTRAAHSTQTESQPVAASDAGAGVVKFRDTPLDSILSVVALSYGRAVCFHTAGASSLRFTIAWNPDSPLAVFLADVNEFEGMCLTDKRDTLFVDSVNLEENEK